MSEDDSTSDNPLVAARMAKHEDALRAGGYPYRFERTDLASALAEQYADLDPAADRESGSAGMPRPNSDAVFCFKKKKKHMQNSQRK